MRYSDDDLRAAAAAGVIDPADLERLMAFLARRRLTAPASDAAPAAVFDAAHLLWYAGALIVIGAMDIFSTVAFTQMGGAALTLCALASQTVGTDGSVQATRCLTWAAMWT
jgi:hypothetical protein